MPMICWLCSPVASTKHLKSTPRRPITCMRLPLPKQMLLLVFKRQGTPDAFCWAVCPQNRSILPKSCYATLTSSNSANHTQQFFSSIYIQNYFTKGEESNGDKIQTQFYPQEANQSIQAFGSIHCTEWLFSFFPSPPHLLASTFRFQKGGVAELHQRFLW